MPKSHYGSDAAEQANFQRLATPNDAVDELLRDDILEEVKFNCGEINNGLKTGRPGIEIWVLLGVIQYTLPSM